MLEVGGLFFGPEDVLFWGLARGKGLVLGFVKNNWGKWVAELSKAGKALPPGDPELRALAELYQKIRQAKGLGRKVLDRAYTKDEKDILWEAARTIWELRTVRQSLCAWTANPPSHSAGMGTPLPKHGSEPAGEPSRTRQSNSRADN